MGRFALNNRREYYESNKNRNSHRFTGFFIVIGPIFPYTRDHPCRSIDDARLNETQT